MVQLFFKGVSCKLKDDTKSGAADFRLKKSRRIGEGKSIMIFGTSGAEVQDPGYEVAPNVG